MLAHVLTPEAVQQHPLTWHEHAMVLANTMLNVESRWAGGAVAALALFLAREPLMDLAGKLVSSKSAKTETKPDKTRPSKRKAGREAVEKIDD